MTAEFLNEHQIIIETDTHPDSPEDTIVFVRHEGKITAWQSTADPDHTWHDFSKNPIAIAEHRPIG